MLSVRLIEYSDLFNEPAQDISTYLSGIDRETLLRTATHFLARFSSGESNYKDDLYQIFGPYNYEYQVRLRNILDQVAQAEGAILQITHAKVSLQIFEYAFSRDDQPRSKSSEQLEKDILKAYLVLNSIYIKKQTTSVDDAKIALPDVPELAMYILSGAHADFDVVNNGNIALLLLTQTFKAVRLFQFLDSSELFRPLLSKFTEYYDCTNWQDYVNKQFGISRFVIEKGNGGRSTIVVEPDNDYQSNIDFFEKMAIQVGENLDEHDFISLRAKPLYKESEGSYGIIYPAFLAESVYKALFFKLMQLNNNGDTKVLGTTEFRGAYCDQFSEQFLLNTLLNEIFEKGGFSISGTEILAGEYFKDDNHGEPDYYFRSGRKVMLFESKDVFLKKDVKSGDAFLEYLEEVKKKFFFEKTSKNKIKKKAVKQLVNNILRLHKNKMTFDKNFTGSTAIVYPILLVHDRQYNLPGLNVLVNTWLTEELSARAHEGIIVSNVHPLVIIDIDTIIAFYDTFRKRKIVLFEALDSYYRYLNTKNKTVKTREESDEVVLRAINPFSKFFENYAKQKRQSPVPQKLLQQILMAIGATKQ